MDDLIHMFTHGAFGLKSKELCLPDRVRSTPFGCK